MKNLIYLVVLVLLTACGSGDGGQAPFDMVNSGVWKLSGYCDVTVGLPDDCDDPQPITCNGVVGIEDEINVSFTEKWIEHGSDRSVYNLIHIVDNDYQREGSPTVSVQVRDDGFLYYRTSGDCHARFTR